MTNVGNYQCIHPRCTVNHLLNPVLAHLYDFTPQQFVEMYVAATGQLQESLRENGTGSRSLAFLAGMRISMECYMKGLWVGLVATPAEVVHDASGGQPILLLEKLQRIVFSQIFKADPAKNKTVSMPTGQIFDANDVLNLFTHTTAEIVYVGCASSMQSFFNPQFYSNVDGVITKQVNTLRYVAGMFRAGKTKREIISELQSRFHGQPV
jgi:hypothetical protein